MFWRKKTQPPKQAQILNVYLAGVMPLVVDKLSDPYAKAGIQVFIMGMADMLRQSEKLEWADFVAICHSVFKAHKLLPEKPIDEFVKLIGEIASTNDDVAKVMRVGAQSIQMYVAERDADAPLDLLSVTKFVERDESSFAEIAA